MFIYFAVSTIVWFSLLSMGCFFIVLMRLTPSTVRQWHIAVVMWCQRSDWHNEVFRISRTCLNSHKKKLISPSTLLRCQICVSIFKTPKSFRYNRTVRILQNASCGFSGLINVGHVCLWFIAEKFLYPRCLWWMSLHTRYAGNLLL